MGSVPTTLNYRVLAGSVTAANDNHTYHTITGSQGTRTSVWKTTYAGLSYPGFTSSSSDTTNYDGTGCLGWESHSGSGSPGNPFRVPIPLFPTFGGAPTMVVDRLSIESYPSGANVRHREFINGFVQDIDGTASWGPSNMKYPRNYCVNNIMCDSNSFLYIETKGRGVYYYYITQVEIWIGD